jgi:hypothetical protein
MIVNASLLAKAKDQMIRFDWGRKSCKNRSKEREREKKREERKMNENRKAKNELLLAIGNWGRRRVRGDKKKKKKISRDSPIQTELIEQDKQEN